MDKEYDVYLSRNELKSLITRSLEDKPHADARIKQNHNQEHLHFLSMINKCENVIDGLPDNRISLALSIAWRYGQIDGEHHKMWVIDQMVRCLCGSQEEYEKWVAKYQKPLENGDHYEWDSGITP